MDKDALLKLLEMFKFDLDCNLYSDSLGHKVSRIEEFLLDLLEEIKK